MKFRPKFCRNDLILVRKWKSAALDFALSLTALCFTVWLICVNSWRFGRCSNNFESLIFKLIIQNSSWYTPFEIAVRWMAKYLTIEKSTLVEVTSWCHQATNHYQPNFDRDLCHHMVSLFHSELTHWGLKNVANFWQATFSKWKYVNLIQRIITNWTNWTKQCLKLMVAQSPLATKNWSGPVKFDLGQVKIIIDYIRREIFQTLLGC